MIGVGLIALSTPKVVPSNVKFASAFKVDPLTAVITRLLDTFVNVAEPEGPVGPVDPVAPCAPVGPDGPVEPVAPCAPVDPPEPVAP